MLHILRSMGLTGIEGYEVSVECYITSGLPAFEVVGLPDMAVKHRPLLMVQIMTLATRTATLMDILMASMMERPLL